MVPIAAVVGEGLRRYKKQRRDLLKVLRDTQDPAWPPLARSALKHVAKRMARLMEGD
jgi:hypothetical protein